MRPLAWEPPYAMGVCAALEKTKDKKQKRQTDTVLRKNP